MGGDAASLARRTGLLDEAGTLIRGLPPQVVTGGSCDAEAVWRGAFLAVGSLPQPGRRGALMLTCPPGEEEPALPLALAGAARRLRVPTQLRRSGGRDQVLIPDRVAAAALLARIGAPHAARAWHEQAARAAVPAPAGALAKANSTTPRPPRPPQRRG